MTKSEVMKLKTLVYLSICLSSFAEAKTYYVLVDGGASKTSNYYRYYNEVRRGYETVKARGDTAVVLAKDGAWKTIAQADESLSNFALTESGRSANSPKNGELPVYPPINGKAQSAEDLKKALQGLHLSKDDKVVLYMTGHGGSPSGTNPSSATYEFFNNSEKWQDITKTISQVAPDTRIKIATTACFGGGVHSLSRSLPNVCSSTIAPYFMTSSSGTFSESLFSEGFWGSLQESRNPSFASMTMAGLQKDIANANLGSISSFDYVDFVLKQGVYGKPYRDSDFENPQTIGGRTIYKKKNHVGRDFNSAFPLTLEPIGENRAIFPNSIGRTMTGCSNVVQSDLDKIARLAETLNQVSQQVIAQNLKDKANRQPAQVRTIFNDVIDDMQVNGARYLATSKAYEEKYRYLVNRWNAHKAKWWYGEGEERAKLQKEFDDLKSNSQKDLKQYWFNHQMLERLERLDKFNKQATPQQKEKFIQLLRCEWEPI